MKPNGAHPNVQVLADPNKSLYEEKRVALFYHQAALQVPETIIFIKYRDHLWNKRILDIGCGGGRTTAILRHVSGQYTGVDYSAQMVEICRKRFPDVSFLQCDARKIEAFAEESVDFVLFSFNGLDCVGHEDRLQALGEIRRILRKQHLFVFSSHNRRYHLATRRPSMRFSRNPVTQTILALRYGVSWKNHLRNRARQDFQKEYAIINDSAHGYRCLHYYINREDQMAQLQRQGFEVLEILDTFGNQLDSSSDDTKSAWLYYVARKQI